jgi:hypothetical protein
VLADVIVDIKERVFRQLPVSENLEDETENDWRAFIVESP